MQSCMMHDDQTRSSQVKVFGFGLLVQVGEFPRWRALACVQNRDKTGLVGCIEFINGCRLESWLFRISKEGVCHRIPVWWSTGRPTTSCAWFRTFLWPLNCLCFVFSQNALQNMTWSNHFDFRFGVMVARHWSSWYWCEIFDVCFGVVVHA